MNRKPGILLLTLMTAACGQAENSDTDAAPTAPFLTASDLAQPSTTVELDSEEFGFALELASLDFQATHAAPGIEQGGTEKGEDELCFDNKMKDVKAKAEGSKISFAAALDLAECFSQTDVVEGITIKLNEAKTTIFMQIECEGKDLSALNDRSIVEIDGSTLSCASSGSILNNSRSSQSMTLSSQDQSVTITSQSVYATGTATNQPCVISRNGETYSYADDCQKISISTQKGQQATESSYTKLLHQGISWQDSDSDTWFASGSIQATLNNWNGTVQFSGPDQAPAYSFSNGSETLTGNIQSGLFLQKELRTAIKDPWDRFLKRAMHLRATKP